MIYYTYDNFGYLLGEQASPVANATVETPPEVEEGFIQRYIGGGWIVEDIETYKQNTRKIPTTITPRQLRLALLSVNLLDEVEVMVATDRAMGIWWEYSLDIERNNEYIINAGLALSLTEKQIDDLFISASKL